MYLPIALLKTKLLQQRQTISVAALNSGVYITGIAAGNTSIKFIKN